MAFGAELIARLGLDPSSFHRGLAQADKAAGQFGKSVGQKIGTQGAFRSLVAGVGISVESIAEKIAEAWVGGTRKGLEEVAALYDRETELIQKNIFDRLPDEAARRAFIQKEMDKATKELQTPRAFRTERDISMGPGYQVRDRGERKIYTESEDDFEKRQAAARVRIAELQGTQIQGQNKDKQESINLDKQLAEASEARLMRELDAGQKVAHLAFKRLVAEQDVERAEEGSVEQKKAKIALERVSLQLLEAQSAEQAEIERNDKEAERTRKEAARREKPERENAKRIRAAEGAVGEARQNLATARGDALRVSIQEAAAGQGGVTQSSKAKARQILGLEERAKRIMQSGATDFRDEKGNRMSAAERAGQLQSRAEQLRKSSGFLKSSDRDPLAAQVEAVKKSEEHLREIKDALAQEEQNDD